MRSKDGASPQAIAAEPQRLRSWVLAGCLGLAGFVLLHLWTPAEEVRFSICLSRRLLGLPCPGCGMTRALAHLAKGEWQEAVAAHPFSPLLAAEAGLGWLAWGAALAPGRLAGRLRERLRTESGPLVLANVALLLALWLGRLAVGALPR